MRSYQNEANSFLIPNFKPINILEHTWLEVYVYILSNARIKYIDTYMHVCRYMYIVFSLFDITRYPRIKFILDVINKINISHYLVSVFITAVYTIRVVNYIGILR